KDIAVATQRLAELHANPSIEVGDEDIKWIALQNLIHLLDLAPHVLEGADGGRTDLDDFRRGPCIAERGAPCDTQPLYASVAGPQKVRRRRINGRRIPLVVAGKRVEHEGGVAYRPGEWPDVSERRRGARRMDRYPRELGFDTEKPAECGWDADRSASVSAKAERSHARGDARRRATA